ncbi:hypothetical protein B1400_0636 [Bifidobacterium italicum]|uniref:Uncharacterized protein n=1 Tax=Bifidobacterium italicum TaxID=1960968 RepID=A0A2A2EKB3_9BIFI|nr:hypothetical protein [Bifidobacterium italicum]PAU69664.1 hypothetical protein B1400_0636 [Bifidobacterium italicum]
MTQMNGTNGFTVPPIPPAPGSGAPTPPPMPAPPQHAAPQPTRARHAAHPIRQLDGHGRTDRLPALPGQPVDHVYEVTDALPQPERGLGYVVERVAGGVRILAWIRDDMKVYHTEHPIDEDAGDPLRDDHADIHLDQWDEGSEDLTGAMRVRSIFDAERGVSFGEYQRTGNDLTILAAALDFGPYAHGAHPMTEVLAASWLLTYHFPTIAGRRPGVGLGRIFDEFRRVTREPVADAVDAIVWKGAVNASTAAPADRFAARELIEAGAAALRPVSARESVRFIIVEGTNLFWAVFNGDMATADRHVVLAIESALNRIGAVRHAADAKDNENGFVTTLDEAACYDAVRRRDHIWSQHVEHVLDYADVNNRFARINDAAAAPGGMWDTLTRFITIGESLILPHRFEYRADVNTDTGEMAIIFSAPDETQFQSSDWRDGHVVDVREMRAAHAATYALELAGLLAQIAFTAGPSVNAVTVTGYRGSLYKTEDPVLSLRFDRARFTADVLPRYRAGAFDDASLDDDPARVMPMLEPTAFALAFNARRGLDVITPLPVPRSLLANRTPLWADTRPLPPQLSSLLRADRAQDLDILHDNASIKGSEVMDLRRDNEEDTPIGTSIELESVIMQIEMSEQAPANQRPLYCESPTQRLLVSLVDDGPDTRYWKAPDALYNARVGLTHIYRDDGDYQAAVAQAQAMERIAPTCASAYFEEAVVHADNEDYEAAARVLKFALTIAVARDDVDFVYYRLAYALWNTGDRESAAACYAMRTLDSASYAPSARREVAQLLAQLGWDKLPDHDDAVARLREVGIPVAPQARALDVLAEAAMGLVDAGFPCAADAAADILANSIEGDVLRLLRQCLRYGVLNADDVLAAERGE